MRSDLQQLENNEGILLMYLADELAPQDRAEVAQMLATDPGLRAELVRLQTLQDGFDAGLAELDRIEPLAVSSGVAVRQVARGIAQWHAARVARPAPPAPPGLRYPWWAYPTAAAAAVMLAFLVWWGNKPDTSRLVFNPPYDYPIVLEKSPPDPFAYDPIASYAFLDPGSARGSSAGEPAVDARSADTLDEVERELYAVSQEESGFITLFADPADMEAATLEDF